jgi:hypothetical protein
MLILKGSYSLISFMNFSVKRNSTINPMFHFTRTQYSIIPLFHQSNCERSELGSAKPQLIARNLIISFPLTSFYNPHRVKVNA